MEINKILKILKELVIRRSDVSAISNEKLVADYIYNYLSTLGTFNITKQIVEGERYNIMATNSDDPKLLLFGHMDTVPLQDRNPGAIVPKVIDGKLFGLGAVDMKAGLALMLHLAAVIKRKDIGLIFTVDEEYQFKGIKKLTEEYNFQPKTIINLEPTDLKIGNGCRGIIEFTIEIQGRSAHASRKNLGINAIEKLITLVSSLETKLRKTDTFGETSVNLAYIQGGTLTNNEVKSIGNFVPNYAKGTVEIRLGSTQDKDQIFSIIRDLSKSFGLENIVLKTNFSLGSMYTPKESLKPFEESVENIIGQVEYKSINETGFYEVQLLQERFRSNIIIFGPGPGNKSHMADEYVEIESIQKAYEVLKNYCEKI